MKVGADLGHADLRRVGLRAAYEGLGDREELLLLGRGQRGGAGADVLFDGVSAKAPAKDGDIDAGPDG